MKKQRTGLWMFFISIVLYSCKREMPVNGEISVSLSATTYYKNGSEETKYERTGAIERNSTGGIVSEGNGIHYLVNLGERNTTGTPSAFGVSFLFNRQMTPDSITGTYDFPKDQLLVKASLRNEVQPFVSETIIYPTRGKVVFGYDRTTRRIHGTIQNLEFNPLPNDAFGRYRVTLNGNFNGVRAQ
jgi:hypothetical protein